MSVRGDCVRVFLLTYTSCRIQHHGFHFGFEAAHRACGRPMPWQCFTIVQRPFTWLLVVGLLWLIRASQCKGASPFGPSLGQPLHQSVALLHVHCPRHLTHGAARVGQDVSGFLVVVALASTRQTAFVRELFFFLKKKKRSLNETNFVGGTLMAGPTVQLVAQCRKLFSVGECN